MIVSAASSERCWVRALPLIELRRLSAMSSLVSTIHEAAISPEAWPQALEALTDAAGVAGAALIISNNNTGNVDAAWFSGLSAGFKSDYIRHYAALDPYSPLLDAGSQRKAGGFISTLTMATGIRTKRELSFPPPMKPRRMRSPSPGNLRKTAAGTGIPY
jgi:hypothetical protein